MDFIGKGWRLCLITPRRQRVIMVNRVILNFWGSESSVVCRHFKRASQSRSHFNVKTPKDWFYLLKRGIQSKNEAVFPLDDVVRQLREQKIREPEASVENYFTLSGKSEK